MPFCFASHFACLAVAASCFLSQHSPGTVVPADPHGMNPAFIDRTISPTDDFYRFTNGAWLDRVHVPRDGADVSASAQARGRNEDMMWNIVAPTAFDLSARAGTPEQLVGAFLRSGLNEELAERLRFQPIASELGRIQAMQTHGDVIAELARFHRWSISSGFGTQVGFDYRDSNRKILHLWQSGLSLGGRDQYLRKDFKAQNLRAKFGRCIQKTFGLFGESQDAATKAAARVLAIETRLASAWIPESETGGIEENHHHLTVSQLTALAPSIDWPRYFAGLGAEKPAMVDVGQPEYIKAFALLLSHVTVADWKTYLRWQLGSALSPFLSPDFVRQNFELSSALTGQQQSCSRREAVLEEADRCLGSELGQLLSRTEFGLSSKGKVLAMVRNIRSSLRESIGGLAWMAPDTKAKALEKLDRMKVNVCYPDHWRDSTRLSMTDDSYLQNVLRAREFEFQRRLDTMSRPIDRDEWDMRAYAADARYNASLNAITLPAGVLQAPFFDIKADDASNYGSFGTVIGHEMMHAFDGRGRMYDSDGNVKNWWSKSDSIRYDEYQKGFVAQYNAYPMLDSLSVNGKLTLEENIADLGGVLVAYAAFKRSAGAAKPQVVDGFTPEQRFFISFGQIFRSKTTPECERLLLESDPHSPPQYRVKGVLQNVPEFWKAFNKEPPKAQLRIW